jgi:hypothetical protein
VDRCFDVAQRVRAEIGRGDPRCVTDPVGQHALAAVGDAHDPCRLVHCRPEVVAVAFLGLAEVQSDANRDRRPRVPIDLTERDLNRGSALAAALARWNDAAKESPAVANTCPENFAIVSFKIWSWIRSDADIPSASAAQSRVEPTTSENKNVTAPVGTC